jgi:hypothetical protein
MLYSTYRELVLPEEADSIGRSRQRQRWETWWRLSVKAGPVALILALARAQSLARPSDRERRLFGHA